MKDPKLATLLRHDLNQLVALSELLSHASVSRAAEALDMAQPTMSKSLARLRQSFDDPLLVREGNAMHPTPFARDLAIKVQAALTSLSEIYDPPRPFDPATMQGTLRIGGNDYIQAVVGVPFMRQMREIAPYVNIAFRAVGSLYAEQLLVEERCDIVVSTAFPSVALRCQKTFSDPFVCVIDAENADVPRRLDLDGFLALPQVDVSPAGTGMLRAMLERTHRRFKNERKIVSTITSFSVLPAFLKGTNIAALIPERALRALPPGSLRRVELDFELPAYDVCIWWHSKTHTDPFLRWARNELAKVSARTGGLDPS